MATTLITPVPRTVPYTPVLEASFATTTAATALPAAWAAFRSSRLPLPFFLLWRYLAHTSYRPSEI